MLQKVLKIPKALVNLKGEKVTLKCPKSDDCKRFYRKKEFWRCFKHDSIAYVVEDETKIVPNPPLKNVVSDHQKLSDLIPGAITLKTASLVDGSRDVVLIGEKEENQKKMEE